MVSSVFSQIVLSMAYSCVHWLRTKRSVMDDFPIEGPGINTSQEFVLFEKQKRTATTVPTHCYRYSVVVIHWALCSRAGPGGVVGGFVCRFVAHF